MNDTITIRGFVATEIKTSTTPGGVGTASFRFGSTGRRYDRASNTWVDLPTNWFNVQGYRQLAGNMACSIRKGQRVIVVGRLKLRSWEKDGRTYHSTEIDAESVGHDLMWGSANYTRNANNGLHPASENNAAGQGLAEPAHDIGLPDPEGDEDPGEEDHPDDDAAAGIFLVDADGNRTPVDAETGELAGAAV
ncbi:single-stranded DNA-binding protein [Arthrobacter sp. 754]|uniref:single-stranded DNA-binding protein n=1 Tax=Arthrobacter sp. 754 TaxID=3156315 RepID=UPI0033943D29